LRCLGRLVWWARAVRCGVGPSGLLGSDVRQEKRRAVRQWLLPLGVSHFALVLGRIKGSARGQAPPARKRAAPEAGALDPASDARAEGFCPRQERPVVMLRICTLCSELREFAYSGNCIRGSLVVARRRYLAPCDKRRCRRSNGLFVSILPRKRRTPDLPQGSSWRPPPPPLIVYAPIRRGFQDPMFECDEGSESGHCPDAFGQCPFGSFAEATPEECRQSAAITTAASRHGDCW
jgi:hypothetical protein